MGVIINKCDLLEVDEIKALKRQFEAVPGVERVFPVSALAGVGHQAVQEWCVSHLPDGPTLYPKDAVSEHPERFFIAEIIREKIFLQYSQEVPYSTQVWVQSHKERDGKKKDLILAKVFVERKSQMGILIGAGEGAQGAEHRGEGGHRDVSGATGVPRPGRQGEGGMAVGRRHARGSRPGRSEPTRTARVGTRAGHRRVSS